MFVSLNYIFDRNSLSVITWQRCVTALTVQRHLELFNFSVNCFCWQFNRLILKLCSSPAVAIEQRYVVCAQSIDRQTKTANT